MHLLSEQENAFAGVKTVIKTLWILCNGYVFSNALQCIFVRVGPQQERNRRKRIWVQISDTEDTYASLYVH